MRKNVFSKENTLTGEQSQHGKSLRKCVASSVTFLWDDLKQQNPAAVDVAQSPPKGQLGPLFLKAYLLIN